MLRLAALVFAVPLVAACAAAGPAPTPAPPPAGESLAPEIPVRVRWKVISDEGGRLVVDAIVERRAPLSFPVSVRVEAPPGLTLASGAMQFQVPADGATGETARRLEFTYAGSPPSGDLNLVGDGGQTGVGIHATDAYRFGRTAPVKRPEMSGPNIKFGDKDLGPAIPIRK
jgi:hypothetical protein